MIIQGAYIYYAAACLAFVLSSLFCAVVRWCHMCRPYNRHERYFYPARRLMSLIFLGFAMQAVYLFRLHSGDAWFFMRSFLVLFLPVAGTFAFKCYFFARPRRFRLFAFFGGVLPMVMVFVLWMLALAGGDVLDGSMHIVATLVAGYAVGLFVLMLYATLWLFRRIREYQYGEYSNEEDFPLRFAVRVVFLPIAFVVVAWCLFISGSRAFCMWLHLVMSVTNVAVLIIILHPQRKGSMEQDEDVCCCQDGQMDDGIFMQDDAKTYVSEEIKDDIEDRINEALHERKLYLDPNLRLGDLARAVGSNKKYVSVVLNERFGSFYTVLNKMRVDAAAAYVKEHPDATREEIASHCGFANARTYVRNQKKLFD